MFEATGSVLHAAIDAGTGDTLVAAVTGKRIRVISYVLGLSAAGTYQLQSDTTDITGAVGVGANAPIAAPYNPAGHCETAKAEALKITITGGGNAVGHLTYQLVN